MKTALGKIPQYVLWENGSFLVWNCVSLNHCIWQVQGLTKVLEHSQDVLMPKGVILWFYTVTHLSLIHVIALNYVNCILLAAKLSRNVGLQTQ